MSNFFSPITERSFSVRALYFTLFAILTLGALTMVVPFLVMLSGSMETATRFSDSTFFPRYLVNREALWQRYLEAKYHGNTDYLRMAWNDPSADFRSASLPKSSGSSTVLLWRQFLQEYPAEPALNPLGFLRVSRRLPSYYTREFQIWLLARYDGNLERLNQSLGTQFGNIRLIAPPISSLVGPASLDTPLARVFNEFCALTPANRHFVWDAGGYYRSVFLPRTLGYDIAAFNSRYGTDYSSYAEVPFGATPPVVATDLWFEYVTSILRPDLVTLTEAADARRSALNLSPAEFIQLKAQPADLRVRTLDCQFAIWATHRSEESNPMIPQRELDLEAFENESSFWRNIFLTQNYRVVLDEILLNGRAVFNTLILVALSVVGALLVNPLAAYALSRFRLRRSYHILLFFLLTIAFPAEVTMIPVFLQMREFNLLNTFGALVLPSLANGFSIFLLKGFFDSLPKELYEAAEIDGASEWIMFWLITMNLSKPILAVIALGAFVAAYGTFFYALVLAPDPQMWTLMVYIYQLRQMMDAPVVYASLILAAIPTLLVFIFCQNIILRGIVVPSEK